MERDPLTGALKNVQLGSPRRLRIIFDANMRAAHAAGKWARIERVKDAFPFLRYVQVQRDTKRPEHARYHELIRPVGDPVWGRIYPPNGWRCGCTVQQLSQAMMDRRGQSVTQDFTLQERGVLNRRSGEIEPTALGVVYTAVDADAAELALAEFEESDLAKRYPAIAPSWRRAWNEVIPFLDYPPEVRRLIYTTNSIEALNSKIRRAVRTRGHFPSDEAAAKLIYLALNATSTEWKRSVREWHAVRSQLAIMFEDRFPMT